MDNEEEFDGNLDEDLEDDLEEPSTKTPDKEIKDKTPEVPVSSNGKRISVFFMSTVGPGEKKQKLLVNTRYKVGDIKETAANLFGLDPTDFHLSSGGITMEENSTLSEYQVEDGDDILLIPASTAG